MPTENRSSNTEMVSVPRELTESIIRMLQGSGGWKTAEQLSALLAPQPHPEPIAWMVGTAIWWTKEEAERDASATGLTIVGLGPMTGAAPAEQNQAEPVAPYGWHVEWADSGDHYLFTKVEKRIEALRLDSDVKVVQLYTHADPGEVERLRGQVNEWAGKWERAISAGAVMEGQRNTLRAQLAERDALLRECQLALDKAGFGTWQIDELLSASAEPSAPSYPRFEMVRAHKHTCANVQPGSTSADVCDCGAVVDGVEVRAEPEKPSRCTSCDNCQGFNTGHDSTQQKPYSIRCDNCHKEARAADHTGLARAWNALNQGE